MAPSPGIPQGLPIFCTAGSFLPALRVMLSRGRLPSPGGGERRTEKELLRVDISTALEVQKPLPLYYWDSRLYLDMATHDSIVRTVLYILVERAGDGHAVFCSMGSTSACGCDSAHRGTQRPACCLPRQLLR